MQGIAIDKTNSIGDVVQFSSLPENYFRATGKRLVDVSKKWIFDHNPFVVRDVEPESTLELWGARSRFKRTPVALSDDAAAPAVFQSNAEHHASLLNVPVVLNRPRLYKFEDFPFRERYLIVLQTEGRSHGRMPEHVIEHVINKYGDLDICEIGYPGTPDIGIPKVETKDLWELTELISQARMLIGLDSGPAWIASCFPDVVVKRVRTRPQLDYLETWVPLDMGNPHSQWDDQGLFRTFNVTGDDLGFTQSYRRL